MHAISKKSKKYLKGTATTILRLSQRVLERHTDTDKFPIKGIISSGLKCALCLYKNFLMYTHVYNFLL